MASDNRTFTAWAGVAKGKSSHFVSANPRD